MAKDPISMASRPTRRLGAGHPLGGDDMSWPTINSRFVTDVDEAAALRERVLEPETDRAREAQGTGKAFVVDMRPVEILGTAAAAELAGKWIGRLRYLNDHSVVFFLTRNRNVLSALNAGLSDPGRAAYGVVVVGENGGTQFDPQVAVGDVTQDDDMIISLVEAAGDKGRALKGLARTANEKKKKMSLARRDNGHDQVKELVSKGLLELRDDDRVVFPRAEAALV